MWLVLGLVATLVLGHGNVDHSKHGYRFNGPLEFECARNGTFSTAFAPQCLESKKPMSFKYGVDALMMVSPVFRSGRADTGRSCLFASHTTLLAVSDDVYGRRRGVADPAD